MHEIHIVRRIAQIATTRANKLGLQSVKSISVSVSALTHLNPDSLRRAFSEISGEHGLTGADLQIETSQPECRCEECGTVFAPGCAQEFSLRCSKCGSSCVVLTQAQEVDVTSVEA